MLSDKHSCLEEAEAAELNGLVETLSHLLSCLLVGQWAAGSPLLSAIIHAGVAYGDATVFESFVAL